VQLSALRSTRVPKVKALYAAVRGVLQRDGVAGVLRRVVEKASEWREERQAALRDPFDAEFGTDTAGVVPLWKLNVEGPHRDQGVRYQATHPDSVRRHLAALPIAFEQFAYVDLGSGKGRTLLVASEFPFRRVTGVEFSPELHAVAEDNIRKWQSPRRRCSEVRSVCADAAASALPDDDLVLFMYNPFGAEVMERVIQNLERSLAARDRDVYVVYDNPLQRHVLDACAFLKPLPTRERAAVYVHEAAHRRESVPAQSGVMVSATQSGTGEQRVG
jgi:predicted RNA methylase